ncbi:SNF2 family N-terminal domain-containing protein [Staphylotrichum tortipilum]|uniref:SNF2 family N-terminal domain-containing protein n=1 Tax=Staphylotrichum tortipilum TaxID=2831512 RepID=A0AAN6RXB3_9PEZI|nr:SNF2 family N-terminal domain-containing protein [Staphylotrichum longicolle]
MADEDQSDPFLWDEDRVVQELCTDSPTWKAHEQRPDPAAFEVALRDHGVDGESLLTYSDEFSFDKLCSYLGIKKFPHQRSLNHAISRLQKRSPRYSEWKAAQLADSQPPPAEQDNADPAVKSESHPPAEPETTGQVALLPGPGVLSPALSPSADPDTLAPPERFGTPEPDEDVAEGPPNKKRRIAPTAIAEAPTANSAFAVIPTEGDIFLQGPIGVVETLLQSGDSSGFLGPGILRRDLLTDSWNPDEPSTTPSEFFFVQQRIPPGRRIQISAAMKRFFRLDNLGKLDGDLEDEAPLPRLGDSDDNDSVDSETWREYQEEEAELLALKAREQANKDRLLDKEEVIKAVALCIQELEGRWLAEKKPSLDHKAWKTWQDARRNPYRMALIDSAKRQLDNCSARITRYSQHIINQPWSVKDDINHKASGNLEVSVFEQKRQAWLIDILESPRQPTKPSKLPRPTPRPVKPATLDDGEEELASDSDDMDAFIEYDDVQQPLPFLGDEMEIDSAPPLAQPAVPASPAHDSPSLHGGEADDKLSAPEGTPSAEQFSDDLPPAHPTPKEIKAEKPPASLTPCRTAAVARQVIEIDSSPSPSPVQHPDQIPDLDGLESLQKIGEIGARYWEIVEDAERLVVAVLCSWSRDMLANLHSAVENHDDNRLWDTYVFPTIKNPAAATVGSVSLFLCRLFDVYVSKSAKRANDPNMRLLTCQRMHRQGHLFPPFRRFLRRILPLFLGLTPPELSQTAVEELPPADIHDPAEEHDTSEEFSSDDMPEPSTKKRRRRKRLDKNAANIRIDNIKLNEELARRSRQLREKIAQQGSVSSKQSRLIVNETKESDEDALIYINDHIGSRIKDHQIEGVRFMWNQVVVDSRVRQGCLLAHTMGLGKTMQVITLLVVIAESSASPDNSVRSQIPESLRETRTLILCPASLVDNWYEEIRMWAPDDVLGITSRMPATLSPPDRVATIKNWALTGGVLIIGYTMFSGLVRDNNDMAKLLQETPSLVVGDEAHFLKNPESQRHQAAANFKTMNRIAMTGSPLTNNVMDYYSMINWVAPNYLADIAEFKQRFSNPIKEGLYADSEPYQKRKARKMLQVLKATVDPKVHRRDIEVLRNELPKKKEFILTLPLTKLQTHLYRTYIRLVTDPGRGLITGQAKAWSLVANLSLVLAHPFIFKTVAETQKANRNANKGRRSSTTGEQQSEEADASELPQDVLHDLLATVAIREIADYSLSWKMLILLRILDECKKVRDKVLVFSQSLSTLDYIENICKRQRVVYQRLDGQTPMATRQDAIKKFNTAADSEVYLVSTTAGGVGLNIYGANRVVIFDFKYTPADEQQAIGRVYRLGQTKPVYVYWLTIGGTFEDTIHNNAVFKTQLASRVVDKKNPDPWSKRLSEYFAMPREVDQDDLSGAKGQDQVLDALLADDDIGQHIRKITSTETFEKEETYELTAEEKREVEDDVKLELLRSQDPEAFKRRERERLLQQQPRYGYGYGMPLPPSSFYQPQQQQQPQPQPQPQTRPADGDFVVPSPAQAPPLQQSYPLIGLTYHQSAPSNAADPAPQPILAPGTHYKPVAMPSLPPLRSGSPTVGGSNTSALLSVAAEIAAFDFPHLPSVHSALCQEGRHVRHHPSDLIARVKEALARNKVERLPMMDKLQNMEKFSWNPRFAEAMLSGHLEPEQLATMTRVEMEEISASLSGMAEGEFKQRVWTTRANLNREGERARERANRGVLLRLIGAGSEPPDPATPQDRRRGVKPGDSAESPHIID